MTVVNFRDFDHLPRNRTEKPVGDIIPINWWQLTHEIDLLCICCLHRWRASVALSMLNRPQWMGEMRCPELACGVVGMVVKG